MNRRPLASVTAALFSLLALFIAAAARVAAHGTAAAPASPTPSVPTWAGVSLGLAVAAVGAALYARGADRQRLGRALAVVLLSGSLLVAGAGAVGVDSPIGGPATETPLWVSDTGRDIGGNHHAPAVADGQIYAPISGPGTPAGCELVALHGADGGVVWRAPVADANCTIHAVADPAVEDTDGDGIDEVLVATTEEELRVYSTDGDLRSSQSLPDYGYTRPAVADLAPAAGPETVVVDVTGTVVVLEADGTEAWRHTLDDYVWARPLAADVDGDGESEVFVAQRDGTLTLLSGAGEPEWTTTVNDDTDISWLTSGQADDDPALEVVIATVDGGIYAVDGFGGDVEWSTRVDSLASVGGFGDGDGDGVMEVYVADRSGTVRAFDVDSGTESWATRVTDGPVQMMPPPALGDTDGDGTPDLVVPAHDGSVSLLDPATGELRSRYVRETDGANEQHRIFARATLGDVDGDGDDDAVVIYADGTVVALDFAG